MTEFLSTLQRITSCISPGVLRPSRNYYTPAATAHEIAFQVLPPPLQMSVPSVQTLALNIAHAYRIIESDAPGAPWQVTTAGYAYGLELADDQTGREIIVFHWHPHEQTVTIPHIHLEAGAQLGFAPLANAHVPSGRVTLESVVRLAIDLGARPRRRNWEDILTATEKAFEARRRA